MILNKIVVSIVDDLIESYISIFDYEEIIDHEAAREHVLDMYAKIYAEDHY